jgi:hypothetical protein
MPDNVIRLNVRNICHLVPEPSVPFDGQVPWVTVGSPIPSLSVPHQSTSHSEQNFNNGY